MADDTMDTQASKQATNNDVMTRHESIVFRIGFMTLEFFLLSFFFCVIIFWCSGYVLCRKNFPNCVMRVKHRLATYFTKTIL